MAPATDSTYRRLTIGWTEHLAERGAYRTLCGRSIELANPSRRGRAAEVCGACEADAGDVGDNQEAAAVVDDLTCIELAEATAIIDRIAARSVAVRAAYAFGDWPPASDSRP